MSYFEDCEDAWHEALGDPDIDPATISIDAMAEDPELREIMLANGIACNEKRKGTP